MRAFVLAVALLALAGCGGDDEGTTGGAGRTIEVSATDFAFDPASFELEPGTYTFRLTNDGESEHALEIEGETGEEETDTIGPGETAEVTIDLESGGYELYCPVGDHRDRGMEGSIVVDGAATTDTVDDDGQTETEPETEPDTEPATEPETDGSTTGSGED